MDEEIRCIYKAINKTKFIQRYMEALALHTGAPTVHWEYNTRFISVVEDKIFTTRVKHIDISIWFLQEQFYNGLFVLKYDNYSVMPADMCTKTCSGPIISRINKRITGFVLYPTSDIEHNQLIILHDFFVN